MEVEKVGELQYMAALLIRHFAQFRHSYMFPILKRC